MTPLKLISFYFEAKVLLFWKAIFSKPVVSTVSAKHFSISSDLLKFHEYTIP